MSQNCKKIAGWVSIIVKGKFRALRPLMPKKDIHIPEVIMKKSCPDDEMLTAYVEGLVPDHQKPRIEAHLSECDACLEEFKLTNSIVRGGNRFDADTMPPEVTQSAMRLVNRQISMSNGSLEEQIRRALRGLHSKLLGLLRLPALGGIHLAPIRGSRKAVSDDLFRIKKSFREFDTEIGIEKTGENTAHIRVRLFESNGCSNKIRVTLKRGERELCSSLFSGGRVLFEDISFGPCKLIFDRDAVSLGSYLFDIKETRNGKKRP